jgi:integrase
MAYAEKVYKTRAGKKTKQYTWRARFKLPDGTWGSESGFPTKTTAEKYGEKQEATVDAGKWIDPEKAATTFGEFARRFMANNSKRGNTLAKRWTYLNDHLLPKWEHTPIRAFTWFDVDGWQQTLPVDDVTRGHIVSLLSTILTAAMDAGLRDVNPIYGRRRTKPTGKDAVKDKPKKTVGNQGVVPPERVVQLAERLGPVDGLLVLTVAFAGLRYGEAIGLHRDNLVRTREQLWAGGVYACPVVRIVEEVAEYDEYDKATGKKAGTFHGLEETKNDGSMRDVDLPPSLALLLRYRQADCERAGRERAFTTWGGQLWRRGHWSRILRPAADGAPPRQAGRHTPNRPAWEPIMPGLDMRSLRHTHDSYQSQIGVAEPLAYEAMGHKREGIKAVYQHPTVEMRIARLEGLEEIFQRAMRTAGLRTLWDRVDLRKIPETITVQDRQAA